MTRQAGRRRVLYIAPYFRRWLDLEILSPLNVPVSMAPTPQCPGCMLVFDSMEAMREVYPDVDEARVKTFVVLF